MLRFHYCMKRSFVLSNYPLGADFITTLSPPPPHSMRSNPKRAKLDCLVKNGFDFLTFYRKLVFAENLFHISKRLVALGYDFYTERFLKAD